MVDADVAKAPDSPRPSTPCELCDARLLTAFNWSYAASGEDQQLARLRRKLQEVDSLKSGWLYRCPICDQAWYLDVAKSIAVRVPRDREQLLREWSSRRYEIPAAHHDVLRSIGGVEENQRGSGSGYLRIPCAVQWADGAVSDPCLIDITNFPPILETMRQVRLFAEVAHVEPSRYTLPRSVRCATRGAQERRMGFAPTAVQTPTGRIVLLGWVADIFDHDGVAGSEVRLARGGWRVEDHPPIVSEPLDRITFVLADPSDMAAELGFRCA